MDRYIPIKAINVGKGQLIPFFDDRVKFHEDDYFGGYVTIDGNFQKYCDFVDCVYDIDERKVKEGIVKDYYPSLDKLEFKVGGRYLVEEDNKTMQLATLVEVLFDEFQDNYRKGSKIEPYELKGLFAEGESVDKDAVYVLRYWETTYVFNNGFKTKYSHQIKLFKEQEVIE